jgi:hypothetical protein
MNILILGCSFGVPNYYGSPGVPAEHHVQFLLTNAGHTVHNCAENGGSNLNSLNRAKTYLSGEAIGHPAYGCSEQIAGCSVDIDWVIWFHTEIFRDPDSNAREIYSEYAKFFAAHNSKIAVIGGAGDTCTFLTEYITPDFYIPSWRQYLLGDDLPTSNTLWTKTAIVNSNQSKEEKMDQINSDLLIRKRLQESDYFPDGCHPGTYPHCDLFNQLQKVFATQAK